MAEPTSAEPAAVPVPAAAGERPQGFGSPPTGRSAVDLHERRTRYRPPLLWLGAMVVFAALATVVYALGKSGVLGPAFADLGVQLVGVGSPVELVLGFVRAGVGGESFLSVSYKGTLLIGCALWVAGWGLVALGTSRKPAEAAGASEAVGAPLYPRLARYRDFYWSTLAAYGGGFVLAELVLIVAQTVLASGTSATSKSAGWGLGLPAPLAFVISGSLACVVAFGAGFLGAARAKRLSTPEATLGFIYFGLPIPLFLTLTLLVPELQLKFGFYLREVFYLASLLGRAELGIWLVYAGIALAMVLGITSGFVATGSGRLDLRAGFEVFIAGRHVSVFNPLLLLLVGWVLLGGILLPLIIIFIVKAADKAVEKTRVRRLGEADPLLATAAQNEARLKKETPTELMTALSVGGVGVGVMALIIVLSVMSGFEADLQQKILGTNAHAVVLKYADSFENYGAAMKKIATVPGVKGQTPFIMNEVMISSEGNISGTIIKGIDPETVGEVSDLPHNVLPGGSIDYLEHPEEILPKRISKEGGAVFDGRAAEEKKPAPDSDEEDPIIGKLKPSDAKDAVLPGIIVGRELASSLKVVVGDRLNVVSPLGGELGPQGPMPKSRPFRVAGIFYSGMYEYDSKFVYIRLDEAQKFFGMKGVTGIELKVADIDDARKIARQVYDKLEGYPYHTKDWGEMNKNLFSALRLEKLVMGIILSIIVIVAAGLIVATVIMLVLEKRKEIAVLKALGVPDGGIVKIFLAEGLQIGIAGGLLGLFSGLAWCLLIEKVGIKLDPEVYYIPALPVRIEPFQTGLAVVIAVLVTYLGSIYPALEASEVEPVEGLKAE